MIFIPPEEKIIETKKCRLSGQEFFITDKDLEFYDKISPIFGDRKYSISSPTLCPDERQKRRLTFRNERKLYKRKCDKTGQEIISIYSPDKPCIVYDQKVWWGDDWSPFDYGMSFDFEKPFFEQFHKLQLCVPRVNLFAKNAENSAFTNHTDGVKNCYLSTDIGNGENMLYSKWGINTKSCCDIFKLENSEYCYQSRYLKNCHRCFFSTLCDDSSECYFSYGLKNCHNCLFCHGNF